MFVTCLLVYVGNCLLYFFLTIGDLAFWDCYEDSVSHDGLKKRDENRRENAPLILFCAAFYITGHELRVNPFLLHLKSV